MNAIEIKAPFYDYDRIRIIAKDFLSKHNIGGKLPVPIERIVEFNLKMNIIPIPGMVNIVDSAESWITMDFDEIYIDKEIYEKNEYRYRFSLAHEVGHSIMHKELFSKLSFANTTEWKKVMKDIPSQEYSYIEQHAYIFAGLVLVPEIQLEEKYKKAVLMAENEGYYKDNNKNIDTFNQYVSTYLQKIFNVSSEVILRRIKFDNLS